MACLAGLTDWLRWTTDQRLLVTSGPAQPIEQAYVVWLSQPPVVEPVTRCESYELSTSATRQEYFPWGSGRTWVGGCPQIYASGD